MTTVLLVFHLFVVLALIGVVLLQRSEGGGLGLGGGGSSNPNSFLTGRGQANVLTRTTSILAGLFFITSLTLGILANNQKAPKSLFDSVPASTTPSVPSGGGVVPPVNNGGGGLLDELKREQDRIAPPSTAPLQVPTP
jgi:preprotein translocase subunit SecG